MQQLTSLDAQFLAMESARTYGHVSGLAIYDPSTAPGGTLAREDVCRLVGERIHLLPPFRWKLAPVPLGIDHPYWVEDEDFDLDFHIREAAVPPPGDDRALADVVARLVARPLDRAHPLWELYLIHGLPGGRVAALTKVHHAAVDGVSGAEILGVLVDLQPEGREITDRPEEGSVERTPRQLEMLGRGLLGVPLQPVRAAKALATLPMLSDVPGVQQLPGVRLLNRVTTKALNLVPGLDAADILERPPVSGVPTTRFNGKITPHRRFSFGSLQLDRIKAIKNELSISVNDVVVALCASAVRHYLLVRDELPDEPLVAMVPVSVRTPEEMGTFGNKVSAMIVPIPTNVADPRERLLTAHAVLATAKTRHQAIPASLMQDVTTFIPPAVHARASRLTMRLAASMGPPMLNLVISNVPGPPMPLYLAGAQLEAHYPVSVITDGVGLNITCMSYRDHVDFGIVVDREMADDAWELMEAHRHALLELDEVICGPRTADRVGQRVLPSDHGSRSSARHTEASSSHA
jgi:WS/DGAT/MGAT family acyltransferase